jgi:hypothetical protein
MTQIRTPKDLRIASNWLIYEYWMLKGLAQLLLQEDDLTAIGLLRNAVLDSFLIHARVLVDFFYRERKYPTDAVAGDYLDDVAKAYWEKHYSQDPDWFKHTRLRIDKGVAHISYDRNKEARDCGLIEREISDTFDEFVKRLSNLDLLGTRWEKIKCNIRAGSEFPVELPPFLMKGGVLKTSFYPLPSPDWYPDEQEDD